MKIRHQISLWITFAGILASLVLSSVVLFDLIEEPYELLDQELDLNASTIANNFQLLPDGPQLFGSRPEEYHTPYWLRIFDGQKNIVFESELVSKVDLPLKESRMGYSVNTDISLHQIVPELEEDELATFRVKNIPKEIAGQQYLFQIARPVESLSEEITELFITVGVGLAVSAIFLILVSYYFAGRILRPIQEINRTANEITEKTLDKRIPLGKQRDEIYDLCTSLNTMFDRLQYSFQKQKEFVANASHELKTPITMLRLSLEESLQDCGTPELFQQRLDAQLKTLLRMSRLVKNLLDLSRMELSETTAFEIFDLSDLVNSVVEDFNPLIQQQNIRLSVQMNGRIVVNADRDKIKRVFINLLENAVKYNLDEGEVHLWVEESLQTNAVNIILFNTGPGIPAEDRERVFEQFYRVEKSRASLLGGSGLGLTIVKKIVELHGGKISIQSKLGEWTQIEMILPILAEQ